MEQMHQQAAQVEAGDVEMVIHNTRPRRRRGCWRSNLVPYRKVGGMGSIPHVTGKAEFGEKTSLLQILTGTPDGMAGKLNTSSKKPEDASIVTTMASLV